MHLFAVYHQGAILHAGTYFMCIKAAQQFFAQKGADSADVVKLLKIIPKDNAKVIADIDTNGVMLTPFSKTEIPYYKIARAFKHG